MPSRRTHTTESGRAAIGWRRAAACFLAWIPAAFAPALDVVGYAPAANDRFASGYPSTPVSNASPSFVGLPYSWLGVGWSVGDPTKSFGFLTPKHYLVARHYGGAFMIRLVSASGQLVTGTQASVTDTGFGFVQKGETLGDISIGELTAALPAAYGLPRYGVLDANTSSTTNSTYVGQSLLVYGRGPDGTQSPRIAPATVGGAYGWSVSGSTASIGSTVATGTLQPGDSGSPDFIPWTNPNGVAELTIIGNNAASDFATVNVYNFVGAAAVMDAVNGLTVPDGYALRVVGTPSNTWVGNSSTSIGNRGAWGLSPPASAPSDKYVLFSGTAAASGRSVAVDTAANLRGLFFKSTGSGTLGFTFAGGSTLTLGRGGITSYDASRQTFTATLVLGDDQYWDVGSGGVTAAAVNTGTAGYLLEIDGSGTARFTGAVSGAGGVALTGRRLELSAPTTFTGTSWIHEGMLTAVSGGLAATAAVRIENGTLTAVDVNPAAPLTVAAAGTATISGTGLSLAAVSNANPAAAAVNFTATSGTITLAALTGAGATRFGSHAAISAGVVSGSITVTGRLTAPILGGLVSAGSLVSGSITGGTTNVTAAADVGAVTGGMLAVAGVATIDSLSSGTVTLAGAGSSLTAVTGGRLTVSGQHDVAVGSLSIGGDGLVDVGLGSVTVLGGLTDSDARGLLTAGMNGGTWNGGSGVTSTDVAAAVAAGSSRAVGWLEGNAGAITMAYAAPGDTNIDGVVDLLDVGNLTAGNAYGLPVTASWLEGDFNYDGVFDVLDASAFVAAELYNAGPYVPPSMSVAPVPEPAALAAVGMLAGWAWAAQRRWR
ncbi:MAG: hypothetical protein FJ286_05665 [Planctomycetes bacterium]|nr:hypothetical protein [Planctomycetota bacterium]